MDFNGFTLPDLTPRIDNSFIDEMNRRNQEMLDSITPLNEILAEEIKPILEGNQKVVEGLNDCLLYTSITFTFGCVMICKKL